MAFFSALSSGSSKKSSFVIFLFFAFVPKRVVCLIRCVFLQVSSFKGLIHKMFVFSVFNTLPVIAKFLHIGDLKNLSMVNRTFQEITRREDLMQIVFDHSPMCLFHQARSFFILYKSIPVHPDIEYHSVQSRKKLQWAQLGRLFRLALARHGGITGIQRAHRGRQNRIRAMKDFWLRKKNLEMKQFLSRRQMILDLKKREGMYIGLWQGVHELVFEQKGVILPPDVVYRVKVCMYLSENVDSSGDLMNFVRACKELYAGQEALHNADVSVLTEEDQYTILRHNILWENYLSLYTNYNKLQITFPLRTQQEAIRANIPFCNVWPWERGCAIPPEGLKALHDINTLLANFTEWRRAGLLQEATLWAELRD
jgi:hypothetical protein